MARFSWHSSRAMKSPSPVPPLRPVKKGSKMRSTACGSIPGPRSATSRNGRLLGFIRPSLISTLDPAAGLAVLHGVVAQIPDHLMQMAGIESHLEIIRLFVNADLGFIGTCMVSQNSSRKSSSQSPSASRVGLVASRRDSCKTLLMMVLTRSELLRMMSVSRRSSGPIVRAFGQQLAGMAHRADGIADLVGDAGGQPAERGKLALLHALGHEAGVLEENQRGPGHRRRAEQNAAESPARRRPPRSSTANPRLARAAATSTRNTAGAATPRPPARPGRHDCRREFPRPTR